jgi:hypothetical protein
VSDAEAHTIRDSRFCLTEGDGNAIVSLRSCVILSRQFAILIAIFLATGLVSSAQSISPGAPHECVTRFAYVISPRVKVHHHLLHI